MASFNFSVISLLIASINRDIMNYPQTCEPLSMTDVVRHLSTTNFKFEDIAEAIWEDTDIPLNRRNVICDKFDELIAELNRVHTAQ